MTSPRSGKLCNSNKVHSNAPPQPTPFWHRFFLRDQALLVISRGNSYRVKKVKTCPQEKWKSPETFALWWEPCKSKDATLYSILVHKKSIIPSLGMIYGLKFVNDHICWTDGKFLTLAKFCTSLRATQ